jgi:hypothetical protein
LATLNEQRIAFLATEMVEQVERTEPWKAVEQAGGHPELVSLENGEILGHSDENGALVLGVVYGPSVYWADGEPSKIFDSFTPSP